jgi:hypothetical protein
LIGANTILGWQRDDNDENKLLQINGSKDNSSYIINHMGFMVGKNSAELSLKLHLLRLEMQPLYQDVKLCDLAIDILYKLDSASLLVKLKPRIFQRLPPFE